MEIILLVLPGMFGSRPAKLLEFQQTERQGAEDLEARLD